MEHHLAWETSVASLALAFLLSLIVAVTYQATHTGLSYQRSFTQSLALAGLISAMVMQAVGDDIARGLGVAGALTLVRFRSTLKDPRDLMFVFVSLAGGVSAGVQSWHTALFGTLGFCLAATVLHVSDFGSQRAFDAVLRLRANPAELRSSAFDVVVNRHCRKAILINLRDAGGEQEERVYQLQFSDPAGRSVLLKELGGIPAISGVTLLLQDATVEP